jgi:type I restriction enzyme, S subunit
VFRTEQAAHVSEETYRERTSRVEPTAGDLLYSREGTYFGDAAEVPAGVRVCLGQRMVLLRPDPTQVSSRFLRLWLNSPILKSHIDGHRDGTVAERLNLPTIRGLPVLVPPMSVQVGIAGTLGALDDKIDLNRRTNETLEGIVRALFKSWFVDFDPVRVLEDGTAPAWLDHATAALFPRRFHESDLGKIPEGWNAAFVGDHFRVTMGQSPPGETYNEDGSGLPFYQGRTDFGFRFPTRRVFCSAPARLAEPGDTLVSVRAPVGSLNMAEERCCVGRGVAAVRHASGSRSFTYLVMRSLADDFARFEAEGTVFGAINGTDFKRLRFAAPPPQVVEAFEALVAPLDGLIEIEERESRTLATIRDTLLPKLLSGEARIRDAERDVAAAV